MESVCLKTFPLMPFINRSSGILSNGNRTNEPQRKRFDTSSEPLTDSTQACDYLDSCPLLFADVFMIISGSLKKFLSVNLSVAFRYSSEAVIQVSNLLLCFRE